MGDRNTHGQTELQCTQSFLKVHNCIVPIAPELVKAHPDLFCVCAINAEAKGSVIANVVLCNWGPARCLDATLDNSFVTLGLARTCWSTLSRIVET